MIKEACVGNLHEALRAEELGADRIELCENLAEGGTTPSWGTIHTCVNMLQIPVVVMIRPRGGDFVYTPEEVECMLEDIQLCRKAGVFGIATGVLTPDNHIDLPLLARLVAEAGPLQVTFHKAIDDCADPVQEIQKLRNSGVRRVLTSGGKATASEGIACLNAMINAAPELKIVAAGKVMRENLDHLEKLIHTDEFHGKKIVGLL
jgi:copper homeostasis protein